MANGSPANSSASLALLGTQPPGQQQQTLQGMGFNTDQIQSILSSISGGLTPTQAVDLTAENGVPQSGQNQFFASQGLDPSQTATAESYTNNPSYSNPVYIANQVAAGNTPDPTPSFTDKPEKNFGSYLLPVIEAATAFAAPTALVGPSIGAVQGGAANGGGIQGALEGAGSAAAGELAGSAGNLAGGGLAGAAAGGAAGAGANAGLAEITGGNVNPLSALTAGLQGAAGGAGGGASDTESGQAGGNIDPVSGVPVGQTNISGTNGGSDISGTSGQNNISGNFGLNNIAGLTNGIGNSSNNVSGNESATNVSGGSSPSALTSVLKDASTASNLGQQLETLLASFGGTSYNPSNITQGTNEISAPVDPTAAPITDTGSWADRQYYQNTIAQQVAEGKLTPQQAQAAMQQLEQQQVG